MLPAPERIFLINSKEDHRFKRKNDEEKRTNDIFTALVYLVPGLSQTVREAKEEMGLSHSCCLVPINFLPLHLLFVYASEVSLKLSMWW